ncbi:MAG: hypothetical protein ACK6CP_19755 [Pseudanabaena sp.]|jgi:hypothetical protein|nr:hypothetical protein [Pseudanabaena sp. M109S1SP2A07QC]MCE2886588.1 hypothetical protein [Pseudanabaena sp. 42896M_M3]
MPQIANSIPETSTEILTDVVQPHVVLNLSLSYQDLVEVITKLGLREIIQLKRLLDRQINQSIEIYTGDDELILDEIERQNPAYNVTMTQAVQSALDESQNQKFTNGSDFRDWLVSISD